MTAVMSNLLLGVVAVVAFAAVAANAEKGLPPLTAQTRMSGGPLDPVQREVRFDTGDLKIEVMPATETIKGVARLDFTTKAPIATLVIDLDRNLPVSAISINGRPLQPGAWSNPEGRMTIRLGRTVPAGNKVWATITYAGKPHVAVNAPWDGGFVWAKTPGGQPWVGTAVQDEGCDLFWPCIDYPTYEPDRLDIHLTVPKGLKGLSNGVLKGVTTLRDGRTTWNWRAEHPTLYGVTLNVGPFAEISGSYKSRFGNTIPMFYWYLPGEDKQAKELFADFAPTLDFMESVIGPYPFGDQKMGVVETSYRGMENQTVNAYGMNYAKWETGRDRLFQHEFYHEWFANQLTAANWDDFWLHEGTATYLAALFNEWQDGEAAYIASIVNGRKDIENKLPLVTGKPQTGDSAYTGDIYGKGAQVLHALRMLIGDKAFFETLRLAVYGRTDPRPGNFKPVYRTTPEFIAFVKQTTGTDYQWFFDVYLYSAALPDLVEQRDGGTLSLVWHAPGDKPFPMPLEVEVDGKLVRLAMTGGHGTLAVPAGAHVIIDPMAKVLRRSAALDAFKAWKALQPK